MDILHRKVKVEPWVISPEEEEVFRATDATFQWLCNLSGEELHRYAGQWVAAKDCRIVASGPTMDEMLRQLGDTDLRTVVLDYIRRPIWSVYR